MENVELIFSGAIGVSDEAYENRLYLAGTFKIPVFENEYFILYSLIKGYPKIAVDDKFIRMYMQSNRAKFSNSKYIELADYELGDADSYLQFTESTINIFKACRDNEISKDEFYKAVEGFKLEYEAQHCISTLEQAAVIASEGKRVGRYTYQGYDDAKKFVVNEFQKIDNIKNNDDKRGAVIYGVNDTEDQEVVLNKVCSFGVEALDKNLGGIFEGDMVSVLAPSKGCKSRFCTDIVHNAVVNDGVNVLVWSLENGIAGWDSLIRARHFDWFYNRAETDQSKIQYIHNDLIRRGTMNPTMKKLESASRVDLRTNKSYGKIVSLDEEFTVDTFIEIMDRYVDAWNIKLVCIDYLQLIQGDGKMPKSQCISNAYIKTLNYLKHKKIGGIFPAQVKQEILGSLSGAEPEELANMELRNAAGESYEVIKTPDVNLFLYGTTETIKEGKFKLIPIPSRNFAPFDPIQLYSKVGCCAFYSVDGSEG